MRDITTEGEFLTPAQADAITAQRSGLGGAFAGGARAGVRDAIGQMKAIGGLASPGLRAESMRDMAEAEQIAQASYPSWDQMRVGENGLRWAAGSIGRMLPQAVPAVVAGMATGGAALPALAAGTAATVPFTFGSQLQRMDTQPSLQGLSPAERASGAALPALASAAAQNIIPAGVASRMMGHGVERTVGGAIARGFADIPGNAAAGAAAEGASQYGLHVQDPNIPMDPHQIWQAGAEGGAMGSLFGAAGAAGHLAQRGAHLPGEALGAARDFAQPYVDKAGAALKPAVDAVGEKLGDAKDYVTDKATPTVRSAYEDAVKYGSDAIDKMTPVAKKAYEDVAAYAGEAKDYAAQGMKEALEWSRKNIRERATDVEKWTNAVVLDDNVPDAYKAKWQKAKESGNIGDQMWMASQIFLRKAYDGAKSLPAKIRDHAKAVGESYDYERRLRAMAEGRETVGEDIADADPETARAAFEADDKLNIEALKAAGKKLYDNATDPAQQAKILEAVQNVGSETSKKFILGAHKAYAAARDQIQATRKFISEFNYAEEFAKEKAKKDAKRSDMNTGAKLAVVNAMRGVLGADHPIFGDEKLAREMAPRLIDLVDDIDSGKILNDNVRVGHLDTLADAFGAQSGELLKAVFKVVRSSSGDDRKFYTNLATIDDIQRGRAGMMDVMRRSLRKGLEDLPDRELKGVSKLLDAWTNQSDKEGLAGDPKAREARKLQRDSDRNDMLDALTRLFGDKAESVLAAAEKRATKNAKLMEAGDLEEGVKMGEHLDYAHESDEPGVKRAGKRDSGFEEVNAEDDAAYEPMFTRDTKAKGDEAKQAILYKHWDHVTDASEHGAASKQAFIKLAERAHAMNVKDGSHNDFENGPNARVTWRSAESLGDRPEVRATYEKLVRENMAQGMDKATAVAMAKDDLKQYGAPTLERRKTDELGMNERLLNSMKLDRKYGNSPSGFKTRGDGANSMTLDAKRIVRVMTGRLEGKLPEGMDGDAKTLHLLHEGVAAVQAHLGYAFEIPPDTVVSGKRTYGDLIADTRKNAGIKELSADNYTMMDHEPASRYGEVEGRMKSTVKELNDLRAQRDAGSIDSAGAKRLRELEQRAANLSKDLRKRTADGATYEQAFADMSDADLSLLGRETRNRINDLERAANALDGYDKRQIDMQIKREMKVLRAAGEEYAKRNDRVDPDTFGDVNSGVPIGKVKMREREADYWKARDSGDYVKSQAIDKDVAELSYNREASTRDQTNFGTGRTEIDPFGPTHDVTRGRGGYEDIGKFGDVEADKYKPREPIYTDSGETRDRTPTTTALEPLEALAGKLSRGNAIQRNLGEKLRALTELSRAVDVGDKTAKRWPADENSPHGPTTSYAGKTTMSGPDRARLESLATARKASEVADVVNGLTSKYAEALKLTDAERRGPAIEHTAPGSKAERLDAMLASENYSALTTKDRVDRFLAAARDRYKELNAKDFEDRTPLEEKSWRTLDNLFGKNSTADLNSFYDGVEDRPDPKAVAAQKAAFLERARSGDAELIKEVSTSTDAKGLQRAAEALQREPKASATLDAVNKRLGELVRANDSVAYGLKTRKYSQENVDPNHVNSRRAVAQYFARVDPEIEAAWKDFSQMKHAGEFTIEQGRKIVSLSVHSLDPLGHAFHEGLHSFFSDLRKLGGHDIMNVVMEAASQPHVAAKLRELLKDHEGALKQLDDPEERAAYAYQFWKAGADISFKPEAKTVFQRIANFINRVLGQWSNDERAEHILNYFHDGEFAANKHDMDKVRTALMEPGRNKVLEKVKALAQPIGHLNEALMTAGGQRLRDTGIPALRELADLMKLHGTDVGQDAGFIPTARRERTERMNALYDDLSKFSEAEIAEGLEAAQRGEKGNAVQAVFKQHLDAALKYAQDAGVDVKRIADDSADYFPRVYDVSYIVGNQEAFKNMLRKNGYTNADSILKKLIVGDGAEFSLKHESDKPGFAFAKERLLKDIPHADAAPFMVKDAYQIMNSYMTQVTRRAEWARRLGDNSERMYSLMSEAREQGASERDIDAAQKYVRAVDGTLGDDLNPTARRLMGDMIVYQNIRLLPLAIFSSIIDPLGIMVRGGSGHYAWETFKRGIKEMSNNFKSELTSDEATKFAESVGTIDNAMLLRTLGASYSQGMVGETGRKINDLFFRYNLMEQFNTSMRVGATQAAKDFILKHAERPGMHSNRYLSELGLTADKVKRDEHGELVVNDDVKQALNRWVDGAVLRPDAADKPIWMSDPHFALISHLKQFMFSFNETILKRAVHEVKHGNYASLYALGSYIPVMIAADMVKGLIQGAGGVPTWKQDWDAADYFANGWERAGLNGTGQLYADALHGRFGTITGPTIEQLTEGAQVLGGKAQFLPFLLHSMPANALYSGFVKGGGSADPVFAD